MPATQKLHAIRRGLNRNRKNLARTKTHPRQIIRSLRAKPKGRLTPGKSMTPAVASARNMQSFARVATRASAYAGDVQPPARPAPAGQGRAGAAAAGWLARKEAGRTAAGSSVGAGSGAIMQVGFVLAATCGGFRCFRRKCLDRCGVHRETSALGMRQFLRHRRFTAAPRAPAAKNQPAPHCPSGAIFVLGRRSGWPARENGCSCGR